MQQEDQTQQQWQLLKYLTQEDTHINPIKLRFIEDDEAIDKENQSAMPSSNKRLSEDSNKTNQLLSMNILSSSISSNFTQETISSSKILENETNALATPNKKQELSRDALLQQWKLMKNSNIQASSSLSCSKQNNNLNSNQINHHSSKLSSNSRVLAVSTTPNKKTQSKSPSFMRMHLEKSGSVDKSDFQTQAQLMQQFFNSRIGYGDGKSSAVAKTPTKPISPKFHTTMRSQIAALKNNEELPKSSGKKIDPKNFFLETERRAKQREEYNHQSAELSQHNQSLTGSQFKARPLPGYKEFVLQKSEKKSIQFKEFHLGTEERGRQKEEELHKKLEQQTKEAEEARQFHATTIPDYNELSGKYLNNASSTSPRPTIQKAFNLQTDKRAEIYNMNSANSQYDSAKKGANNFKAHKMPDFTKLPELPKVTHREPTVPVEVKLMSSVRAEERRLFDELIQQNKQKEIEEQLREKQLEGTEEPDQDELIIAFKANPVKKYKPVEIHRSEIPLTQPESPKFKTDLRAKISNAEKQLEQI